MQCNTTVPWNSLSQDVLETIRKIRCVSEIATGTLDKARKEIIAFQAPRHKTLNRCGLENKSATDGIFYKNIPKIELANIREKMFIY